jgi:hypothetical protein
MKAQLGRPAPREGGIMFAASGPRAEPHLVRAAIQSPSEALDRFPGGKQAAKSRESTPRRWHRSPQGPRSSNPPRRPRRHYPAGPPCCRANGSWVASHHPAAHDFVAAGSIRFKRKSCRRRCSNPASFPQIGKATGQIHCNSGGGTPRRSARPFRGTKNALNGMRLHCGLDLPREVIVFAERRATFRNIAGGNDSRVDRRR